MSAWKEQANYVPLIEITSPRWENVGQTGVAWIPEPLQAWSNPDDCGNFPCTALKNVVVKISGSTGVDGRGGSTWLQLTSSAGWTITSAESTEPQHESHVGDALGCEERPDWNARRCTTANNNRVALLFIENLDADSEDRGIQPVEIVNFK